MSRMQSTNPGKPTNPQPAGTEKRQTRFLFTCIGLILYAAPCLSCLFLAAAAEGSAECWSAGVYAGMAAALLAVGAALFAMTAFRKKKYRALVIAADGGMIALHGVCAFLLGAWYWVLAPELLLFALNILWSNVIEHR